MLRGKLDALNALHTDLAKVATVQQSSAVSQS